MSAPQPSRHAHTDGAPADARREETPEPTGGLPWRRADGQVRLLFHLHGTPLPEPAETRPERVAGWLDIHLPGWNDHLALVAAGLMALLIGVLLALL